MSFLGDVYKYCTNHLDLKVTGETFTTRDK